MADPISYDQPSRDAYDEAPVGPYEELDALVKACHEHGIFRLLHDAVESLGEISLILARNLDTDQGRNGFSNLYLLLQTLGRIPPEELRQALEAMNESFARMGRDAPADQPYPPGLLGVRSLLRDEELWQAVGPLLEGAKAFTSRMRQHSYDTHAAGDGRAV